jgi:hypothetical protein
MTLIREAAVIDDLSKWQGRIEQDLLGTIYSK